MPIVAATPVRSVRRAPARPASLGAEALHGFGAFGASTPGGGMSADGPVPPACGGDRVAGGARPCGDGGRKLTLTDGTMIAFAALPAMSAFTAS